MSQEIRRGSTPNTALRHVTPTALACLLAVYAPLCLNLRGSANALLFLFTLIGLFRLRTLGRDDPWRPHGGPTPIQSEMVRRAMRHARRFTVILAFTGCTPLLVVLGNQLSRGAWVVKDLDLPLRFMFIGPCIATALWISRRSMRHMQWGLIAAAIYCGARLIYLNRGASRAVQIGMINTIPFSDITLLLGFLSLLTLGWSLTRTPWERWLKWLACVVALAGSLISASRGGWLAIPFLVALSAWALRAPSHHTKHAHAGLHPTTSAPGAASQRESPSVAETTPRRPASAWRLLRRGLYCVAAVLAAVWTLQRVTPRIEEAISNVQAFAHGGAYDTSVGIRFEIWRASWTMLRQHPWFGVGADQFMTTVTHYVQAGISPAVLLGLPHSHNEVLYALSTGGWLGGAALLAMYVVPFALFLAAARRFPGRVRCAAAMGMAVVVTYAISGLTETFFIISMNTAIYVFFCGAFVALVRRELAHWGEAA